MRRASTLRSDRKINEALEREVAVGEGREEAVLMRWLTLSKICTDWDDYQKRPPFDDFDWDVTNSKGRPVAIVEIKTRRSALVRFGDAMFPLRKHEKALRETAKDGIRRIGVTEYGCGSLVEVNLVDIPDSVRDVVRRDRPGMKPVTHAFYAKGQLTILEGAK